MKYLFILIIALAVSCSKDDEVKPDNRPLREKIVGDWCNEGCYRFSSAKDSILIYHHNTGDTSNNFRYYLTNEDTLFIGRFAPSMPNRVSYKNEGKITINNNSIVIRNITYTKSN